MNGESMTPEPARLPALTTGLSPARRESAIVRRGYLEVRVGCVSLETLDRLLNALKWPRNSMNVDGIVAAAKRIACLGHGFDIRNETVQRIVAHLCRSSRAIFETSEWKRWYKDATGNERYVPCPEFGLKHFPPRAEDHKIILKALSTIIGPVQRTSEPVKWVLRSGVGTARQDAALVLSRYPIEEVGHVLREVQDDTEDPVLSAACKTSLIYAMSGGHEEIVARHVDWYASETDPAVRTWVTDILVGSNFFCYEYPVQMLDQFLTYDTKQCDNFAAMVARVLLPDPSRLGEVPTPVLKSICAAVRTLHDRGQPGLEYLIDSLPPELENRRTSS